MPDQEELLQSIESNLGLPPGFCIRLVDEDDWPFVIKLHALLESAASDFLTRALGRKELADIFTRIEMSNSRTGKIAFIRELKLLPPAHTKFIENLSQIRNQLAHKIGNFGFSIVEHFKAEKVRLKEKEFAAFVRKWAFGFEIIGEDHRSEPLAHHVMRIAPKSEGPEGFKLNRGHLLLAQPKMTILWSALAILEAMSLSICLVRRCGPLSWNAAIKRSAKTGCMNYSKRLKSETQSYHEKLRTILNEPCPACESNTAKIGSQFLKVWRRPFLHLGSKSKMKRGTRCSRILATPSHRRARRNSDRRAHLHRGTH